MLDTLFSTESIVLGARDWLVIASALAVCVAALAVWSYAKRSQLSGLRFVTALLKIVAVAALAFCLLEPMQRSERPRPGANLMALVVDNSRSMEIHPPGEPRSRLDRLRPKLPTDSVWQARLAQDFDVRRYAFDDRVRAVNDLSELEFQGNNSSLVGAIETLQVRFAARPVAGLVLFSDGLATDDVQSLLAQQTFPFPLYPVVDDSESKIKDIWVKNTSVSVSSFELAPVTIEVTVAARGLAGTNIAVRLIDAAGETVDKQLLDCNAEEFEGRVRFQYQPKTAGIQFVTVRAMLANEDREGKAAESRVEATVVNNSRLLAVDRGGGPFRILYMAGRPNWEFKFIRRALEEDIEIELSALLRIANKEMKFVFGDKAVDGTNRLMAGFNEDTETAEQYDESILIPIGKPINDNPKPAFPATEEELFAFHAIILDDIEANFFTQSQMLLLREFVAARGGGLMMLGGQESFLGGGYGDTPLGDVLPVYLRGSEQQNDKDQPVRYELSREGSLEPWLRLRANQADEKQRVEQMPDFLTWNSVAGAKPGAAVLTELTTPFGNLPGLVTQRFGRGRSLALMVGDFWRWSLRRATEETDDLAQSWRQMARWLTNDVPKRVQVEVGSPSSALLPHRLAITVRDAAFKPLDNATIELSITEPDGKQVTATATPDATRPGMYLAEYWSQHDGGYLCVIEVTSPEGELLDPLRTGWTAQPSANEFVRLETNREFLQQLAERSGGELVQLDNLESFAASLPARKVPISELRVEPLWHRPWLVLFALSCLCIEWGLRRWKGLP